jgi:hypothetical protein
VLRATLSKWVEVSPQLIVTKSCAPCDDSELIARPTQTIWAATARDRSSAGDVSSAPRPKLNITALTPRRTIRDYSRAAILPSTLGSQNATILFNTDRDVIPDLNGWS